MTRQDGVVTITLNHPERANALDPAEFHELAEMFGALASATDLRAVIVTGQGERAFCAGLNLRNAPAIAQDLASTGPTGLSAALRAATLLPVPLIARINGACVAGGLGLMGAADLVIAVNTARFGLPEIKHGLYPHVALAGLHHRGAPGVLSRLADTGALIDASAALDADLVDMVVDRASLDVAVASALSTIAAGQIPARFIRRKGADLSMFHKRLDAADHAARLQTIIIVNS
ncbi:enoyl-CoA hydratase/isomerase family protein [Devosia chinhatensis]|uniref:enoyl-CoA hydratase/isomerase family protein n=1 Tax=Devosia chinhatensis TaxID=429727 RepID=UPI001364A40E|nr:enoyl-CoA hydratase/isomerase family protein [Devosia chinhatensis]